jgi:beta-lactamase regulating signal transducer with metallopeptidase domain
MAVWSTKFTLLLLGLWVAHLSLKRANPRWRVSLWRAGSVAAVVMAMLAPWPGSLKLSVSVWQPSINTPTDDASLALRDARESTGRYVVSSNMSAHLSSQPMDLGERLPSHVRQANGQVDSPPKSSSVVDGNFARSGAQADVGANQLTHSVSRPADAEAADLWNSIALILTTNLDWATVCIAVWLLGVIVGLTRWLIGELRIRRILSHSTPVQETTLALLRPLAARLGVACEHVRISDQVQSPSIVGYRRPLILMPKYMLAAEHADDMRAALAHELVHVQSGDLAWDRILKLLSVAGWCHPLCWRVQAAHRNACERVCDIVASAVLEDREAYKRSLAHIALRLGAGSRALGFAMARRPDVLERLRALTPDATATVVVHSPGLGCCCRLGY